MITLLTAEEGARTDFDLHHGSTCPSTSLSWPISPQFDPNSHLWWPNTSSFVRLISICEYPRSTPPSSTELLTIFGNTIDFCWGFPPILWVWWFAAQDREFGFWVKGFPIFKGSRRWAIWSLIALMRKCFRIVGPRHFFFLHFIFILAWKINWILDWK